MIENIPIPIQIITGFSNKKRWLIASLIWVLYSVVCMILGAAAVELPILGVWIIAVGLLSGVILGGRNIFIFVPLLFIPGFITVSYFDMATPQLSLQFLSRVIIVMTPGLFSGILSSMTQQLITQHSIIQEQNKTLAEVNELLSTSYIKAESANRLKSEFISTMSHELRTPLSAIIGFSELILEGYYGGLTEKQENSLKKIQNGGQQLLDIVNGILDFSKFESGVLELKPQPVYIKNLTTNLQDKITPLIAAKDITFNLDVAPDMPAAFLGDENYLTTLFMNLLSNAVKFTEAGKVSMCFSWEKDALQVAVTDTGIGISPDAQKSIFEPFWQVDRSLSRQYGGVGMGLAFVQQLVKAMDGTITVNSTEGVGSTFTVMLPTQAIQA